MIFYFCSFKLFKANLLLKSSISFTNSFCEIFIQVKDFIKKLLENIKTSQYYNIASQFYNDFHNS